MGRPYEIELQNLRQTYQWALEVPIEQLCSFVNASHDLPLIAVGSGGSLTAAHMAVLLHQKAGMLSKAVSPLDFIPLRKSSRDNSVLILSAGGRNVDILSAFRSVVTSEPRQLMALCMQTESPLATLSRKFRYARFLDFKLPSGKDGFLATNSLLAFITILIRAYRESLSESYTLPNSIRSPEEIFRQINPFLQPSLKKDTWAVLYGGWGLPAAIDIESKFTEAALDHAQIADYRNFAHGRHHWLAKRGSETTVVAIITPEEKEIAKRTLDLLPGSIPVLQLNTDKTGPVGSLELIVKGLHLVHLVGSARGIDPGMPRVPAFGRRIYNLRLSQENGYDSLPHGMDRTEIIAIARKTRRQSLTQLEDEEVRLWRKAYRVYIQRLERTHFGAAVFDYDGTLCDPNERYKGPCKEISQELVRLLEGGIVIGIASGRGKSVRTDLQRLIPKKFWQQVLIGYYNGSDIGTLKDVDRPDKSGQPHTTLKSIKDSLKDHPQFSRLAKYELRPMQLTVEPTHLALWRKTKAILHEIIIKLDVSGVQVLESSHSIDVVAPNISKLDVVAACKKTAEQTGSPNVALCVGDKGEWPGNDYALLSTPCSLSVDTVSFDPGSCWNLSPAGYRGVQVTIEYLKGMEASHGALRFRLRRRGKPS